MPRPTFTPDDEQRRTLQALARLARRRAKDDEELTRLIAQADSQGIPVAAIAERADVERKTVYRRLGRPMS
jgi:transcriptional regulator of acetoin/glycerol metabolism